MLSFESKRCIIVLIILNQSVKTFLAVLDAMHQAKPELKLDLQLQALQKIS